MPLGRLKSCYGKLSDEIPTASMADVAFLLVIYFMLTITLSAAKGLDFALPKEDRIRTVEFEKSVLVEIDPDGSLRVDQRFLTLGDLLPYLAPKLELNPQKPVILRPHPRSSYGSMVAVYDVLRQGKDVLNLEQDIQVAIPTEREIYQNWR